MKKSLSCYLIFTPGIYRWAMFLIIPILLLGLEGMVLHVDYAILQLIMAMVLLSAEVIMDSWVFGGIAMKSGIQMEFLKTSMRGMNVLQKALSVNLIRQLVESALLFIIGGLLYGLHNGWDFMAEGRVVGYVNLLLAEYSCILVSLLITRFFDGLMLNAGVVYFVSLLLALIWYLSRIASYVMLLVLVLLSVVLSVVSVQIVMKRVRKSFYDKTA